MADPDLDDILSSALDELDDEEQDQEHPPSSSSSLTIIHPHPAPSYCEQQAPSSSSSSCTVASDAKIKAGHTSPSPAASSHCNGGGGGGETTAATASGQSTLNQIAENDEEKELRETIAKTVGLLGQGGGEGGGGLADDGDGMFDEAFLSKLAEEFEKLGGSGSNAEAGGPGHEVESEAIVDTMVKQLLAKELMYPPLKHVTEAFPAWLIEYKGKVEVTAYKTYQEQYALFQQIVIAYETDEQNMNKILELLTKAQDYGQPPPEIVAKLVPEGAAGGGDGGALPTFPGLGGLGGGSDGLDPEACIIS